MHGKNTTDPLLQLAGHRKPVSRRDFLSRGLFAGAGLMIAPTLSMIAARPASAQLACGGPLGGAGRIPFICIDLAGGANIAGGNVIVGGQAGQLDALTDSGYVKLGIPTDMLPTDPAFVNTQMSLAWHSQSAMLRGIRLRALDPTLAQTNGVVVCARSENDDSVDGGGKGIWQSDNASTSSVFMLAYNPPLVGPRPALTPQIIGNQIGYFRGSGSLETSATPISNSVDLLAEAVVLNYLALHNDTASFEAALPNFGLPASARAALTAFETIR
jgi:hypothetical protein